MQFGVQPPHPWGWSREMNAEHHLCPISLLCHVQVPFTPLLPLSFVEGCLETLGKELIVMDLSNFHIPPS